MSEHYNPETDYVQSFIHSQRGAPETEVAAFFASKVSEQRAAHLLGLAISTFRSQRSRGTLKVSTARWGKAVLVELDDVMAVMGSRIHPAA